MSKVAVYTAIFNNYDLLQPPAIVENDVIDYYCFTNDMRYIPWPWKAVFTKDSDFESTKVASCFLKILGHSLLAKYETTIWIDGNIILRKKLYPLTLSLMQKNYLCVNNHRSRDCIYKESEECINQGKVDSVRAMRQMEKYRNLNFPTHFGLSETTIVFRDNKCSEVRDFQKVWWSEFMEGGHRDQLSFDFARWKTGIQVKEVGFDYRDSEYFYKLPHTPSFIIDYPKIWQVVVKLKFSNNCFKGFIFRLLIYFFRILK